MNIYYYCVICKQKNTLSTDAKSRQQLANTKGVIFNITCRYCQKICQVHVNNVKAEPSYTNATSYGAIIGGVAGILAGPIGVAIGIAAGGLSGRGIHLKEINQVNLFNNS